MLFENEKRLVAVLIRKKCRLDTSLVLSCFQAINIRIYWNRMSQSGDIISFSRIIYRGSYTSGHFI